MKPLLLLAALLLAAAPAAAQFTQTIVLEPGWNAVYLEVQPENNDIEDVFAGVPLESVWRYFDTDGVTGVPQDPGEGLRQLDGWHAWFPPGSPPAAFSDLFTVRVNNAYLVQVAGTRNVTVSVTGTPVLQRRRWAPDAFTFTGFGVDPLVPPTFATWFAASSSHGGQPIYRLNDDDAWEQVNPGERIEAGTAYWVYTRGTSDFAGPFEVALDPGFPDLDFGKTIPETGITLINRAPVAQDIRFSRAAGGQRVPLDYQVNTDPQVAAGSWVPLAGAFPLPLQAGGWGRLTVAPRRSDLQVNRAEQVLVFTNLDGARVLVPAAAELAVYDPAIPAGEADSIPTGVAPSSRSGLWVGSAMIDKVNQTQSIDGSVANKDLAAAAQAFPLRVIVHIDAEDRFTLVSQVVQLFEPGSSQTVTVDVRNADGQVTGQREEEVTCVPGRTVLITRDELFSNYEGLALRGDDFVGNRLSTVAYDFGEVMEDERERKLYAQPLTFDPSNGRLDTLIRLRADSASNPFFHRFHPDHDNRDEFFVPLPGPEEVPEISRTIALYLCDTPGTFLNDEPWLPTSDPACDLQADPAAGSDLLAGKFEDLIIGLHDKPVRARGDLRLRRLAAEDQLNPDPLDLATCTCDQQGVCP